jgi:uncharacterized membrane protein YphA (DoxX/SURF4 family)
MGAVGAGDFSMEDPVSWAALMLRIGGGLVILLHGVPKVVPLGKKPEVGLASLRNAIEKLGFPCPTPCAHGVAAAECLGGACLLLGFFTAWVACILALVMVPATYWKQKVSGFLLGADLPFSLFFLLIALIFLGDGRLSLGALLGLGK